MFAVAYALDGTLVTAPDVERLAFERLCSEATSNALIDVRLVERAFETYAGQLTRGGCALNSHIVDAVRAATGLDGGRDVSLAARYRQIAGDVAAEVTHPVLGAKRVLEELRSVGVRQAILANGLSTAACAKARAIGFDGTVIASEDTGFEKPDPQAFRALIDELALPPECIWYLGADYKTDIEPARCAGLNAVWLTGDADASQPAIGEVEAFLDVVQEPYTRGLLGLRYVMRTALAWRPGHFVPGEE